MSKVLRWKVVCETDKHTGFNPTLIVGAKTECEARSNAIVELCNNGCSCVKILSCTEQK